MTEESSEKFQEPRPTAFDEWWWSEGSGMAPHGSEEHVEHVRRVCEVAFKNGANKPKAALEKIISNQPILEGGVCYYPIHDIDGNFIADRHVDPVSVIREMVQMATDGLNNY